MKRCFTKYHDFWKGIMIDGRSVKWQSALAHFWAGLLPKSQSEGAVVSDRGWSLPGWLGVDTGSGKTLNKVKTHKPQLRRHSETLPFLSHATLENNQS